MRIDEIDIYGDFKLNGLTGNSGQFLGISGSQLYWLDSAESTGGINIYGSRYVFCNANPTSATTSGVNLINALGSASNFAGLSVDNRAAVIVSPGTYDFYDQPLQFSVPYVDIIGLSSDANSVRLKASNYSYVIYLDGGSIDMGLYNVTLGTASDFNLFGAGGDYLRWNNVINYGNMFYSNGTSTTDLNGEFKNIKVYDSIFAFYITNGEMNGTYENIELINVDYAFWNDFSNLSGTYSNIVCRDYTNEFGDMQLFSANGQMNGTFKDIIIASASQIFNSNEGISGNFDNIEVYSCESFIITSTNEINGTFNNIIIRNASQDLFSTNSANIVGTFSNIEISSSNNIFYCSTSGNISGTFENITRNNTGANGFTTDSGTISGTFEDIKLGDTGVGYFKTGAVGSITGTFKNIEMGDIAFDVFYSQGYEIKGTFSNIKIGNVGNSAFMTAGVTGDIFGTFDNIEIGNVGDAFVALNGIKGEYKNITIGTVSQTAFFAQDSIQATFSNIKIKDIVSGGAFIAGSGIDANVKDIFIDEIFSSSFFQGATNNTLTGNYENIKIKSNGNFVFTSGGGISGTFKDIDLGTLNFVGGSVFGTVLGAIQGTFEDIKMNASTGLNIDIFYANLEIDGVFKNIDTNTFAAGSLATVINNFFSSGDFIVGTFSNISAGGVYSAFTDNLSIDGNFTDLNINAIEGTLFSQSGTLGNAVIRNSILYGRLGLRSGKLIDSTVDNTAAIGGGSSARAVLIQNGATIERCKLLCNSAANTVYSGSAVNAKISLTIANYAFSGSVTNLIGTPNNIIDSSIT